MGTLFYSLFGITSKLYSKGEVGGPFRDRFQSFRQTFRVEPNPEEARRIINNIFSIPSGKICVKSGICICVKIDVKSGIFSGNSSDLM